MPRKLLSIIVFLFFGTYLYAQQPVFSIQALFGPSGYMMFDETYYKAYQKFNYSAGIYVMANLPAGESMISFRSGYFYDTKKYVREYNATYEWSNKKIVTAYAYGNIPILLEVAFNTRQTIYPFISGGLILGRLLSAEQTNEKVNGEVVEGFPPNSNNKEKQTDFHASAGASFRLNRVFRVRTEVFMSQQLDKDDGMNHDRFGYFSFGLKVGIQYDIFVSKKRTNSNPILQ